MFAQLAAHAQSPQNFPKWLRVPSLQKINKGKLPKTEPRKLFLSASWASASRIGNYSDRHYGLLPELVAGPRAVPSIVC